MARFAALQAERERTWTAEQLAANTKQRASVVGRYDPANHARPGDRVKPFVLVDQDGATLTSAALLANGPAVLLFFRFGSCPACNIALSYYNETLWPALKAAGIPLVAVSPQVPVDRGVIDRHKLGFPLASDPGYALERALGITFLPDEQPAIMPGAGWIGATLGTDSYELPQPTIVILNKHHGIHSIFVSPDWLVRPETETILAHLADSYALSAA